MKRLVIFAAVLLVGLLIGVCLGLAITVPRKVGISEVTVTKQVIDGEDALLVDSPEHPPWAQQHLTSVEFDYDQKTISILRYAVIMSPGFGRSIYSRWPVVIRDGLLPGDYTLQIWRGERFASVGRVVVTDKKQGAIWSLHRYFGSMQCLILKSMQFKTVFKLNTYSVKIFHKINVSFI